MKAAIEAAQGEVPVLTSIQHTDVRVIVELAQYAAKVGIHGVQLSPTYYYPATHEDILRLFQMVAKASDVSLMVYHTWWTGVNMDLDLLRNLAEIETVRILKWSASTSRQFRDTLLALSNDLVVIDNGIEHITSHILGARIRYAFKQFLA